LQNWKGFDFINLFFKQILHFRKRIRIGIWIVSWHWIASCRIYWCWWQNRHWLLGWGCSSYQRLKKVLILRYHFGLRRTITFQILNFYHYLYFWRHKFFFPKFPIFLGKISHFLEIFRIFAQNYFYGENFDFFSEIFDFWPTFRIFAKTYFCSENVDFWRNFRFLVKFSIFDQHF